MLDDKLVFEMKSEERFIFRFYTTRQKKKLKKNVDGNYLLWNNISMEKNIGMLLEAELWFCRSAENEGENICLVREGMGKLAL